MITKDTIALICIATNSIVLNPQSKKKEQIPFTEIAKIHISVYQRQLAIKSFLIGYFIFTLICLRYLNLELSIFSILIFSINCIIIHSLDFKSYRLQIVLKNNVIIEKRIPKKLKHEFVTLINEVRNQLILRLSTSN